MKAALLTTLTFILFSLTGLSQETFHKNYGTSEPENCDAYLKGAVCITTDNGYAFCAGTVGFNTTMQNIYFIRTNQFGDTLFTRVFDSGAGEWGNTISQTSDGGFVIAGWGDYGMYVMKTDEYGDPLWNKSFDANPFTSETMSLEITDDDGLIMAARSLNDLYGGRIIRTDMNGDTLWARGYGQSSYDHFTSCMPTSDNGFIAAGRCLISSNNSGYDVLLSKLDASGNLEWSKFFGGPEADYARDVQQCPDGGYVMCGRTVSSGNTFEVLVIKTNSSGEMIWSKTYGGSQGDEGYNIELTSDGGYVVCANTYSFNNGYNDIYVIKLDEDGNMQWSRTYGSNGNDYGCDIKQTTDGGYIITGSEANIGAGYADLTLIKTDVTGFSNCLETTPATIQTDVTSNIQTGAVNLNVYYGCEIFPAMNFIVQSRGVVTEHCMAITGIGENVDQQFHIFPNPTEGRINIDIQQTVKNIEIHSATGDRVYNSASLNDKIIDISNLANGYYIISLTMENEVIRERVVKY